MNCETKSLIVSLALHSGVLFLAIAINSTHAEHRKPIVIDFTIPGSGSTAPAGSGIKGAAPHKEHGSFREAARKQVVAQPRPQLAKVVPSKAAAMPVLPTSPTGAVPTAVFASPSIPSRNSGAQYGSTAGGGAGSGSGSGTGTGTGSSTGSGSGHGKGNSSGNGRGSSSDQLRKRYLAEHFEYIKRLIEKNVDYPAQARRRGWTGKVIVSFTILENGHVTHEKILSSSGYELLDNNIIETIKSVEPFPRPPVSASLKIPFFYRLE